MSAPAALRLDTTADYLRAITDLVDVLGRQKIDYAFVGRVAEHCWFGGTYDSGSIDVLGLVAPDRMGQLPMMASHRGFVVDRDEVEAAAELDLLPMRHPASEGLIRVHVLMATNALYAMMIRSAVDASAGELTVRVVSAEDLALLLLIEDAPGATVRIRELGAAAGQAFDVQRFNEKLISIGLREKVLLHEVD